MVWIDVLVNNALSIIVSFVTALLVVQARFWFQDRSRMRDWWDDVISTARVIEEADQPHMLKSGIDNLKRDAVADEIESNIDRLVERKQQIESTRTLRTLIQEIEDIYRSSENTLRVIGPSGEKEVRRELAALKVVARAICHHAVIQRPSSVRDMLRQKLTQRGSQWTEEINDILSRHLSDEEVAGIRNGELIAEVDERVLLYHGDDGWWKVILDTQDYPRAVERPIVSLHPITPSLVAEELVKSSGYDTTTIPFKGSILEMSTSLNSRYPSW